MLKQSITYKTLDGEEITEDFYFRLNKAELAELQMSERGGLESYLKRIVESEDGEQIMQAFKKILRTAIGRRSEDGKKFIKNQEIIDDFFMSDAYSELFMMLVTDAEFAAKFVVELMPEDMRGEARGRIKAQEKVDVENMSEEERTALLKKLSGDA